VYAWGAPMQQPTPLTLFAGLALVASFGCGSTSEPVSSTPPPVCEALGYHSQDEPVTIERVKASVRLPSGAAAARLPVQVCGLDACLPFNTDPNGVLNEAIQTSMVLPALKYGDGFDFAELAAPFGSEANVDLGELVALPLPALAEGAKFPKSGALTNGDLTLELAESGSVQHDILTYDEEQLVFRSVAIPVADSRQALPERFGFELAYGVAPIETTFCPPAKLSLKNTQHWSPGSEVEIFVQGLNVTEKWAPYATWLLVAEARVSSDGSRIDTTSGGIPILTSIALRRK
jgi:hypothetical protein